MKSKILLIVGLAFAGTAFGAQLTPGQALLRAEADNASPGKEGRPQYIETLKDSNGRDAIYVFTYAGSQGFMLLPADDQAPAVIGYSETGSFPTKGLPENVMAWMNYYADGVTSQSLRSPYIGTRAEKPAIAPLMKTTWDQTAPFNNECPVIGNRRAVTGCVATAMAQVMKYWEYPLQGKGSISYQPSNVENELSLDFSKITFDWANMLDAYKRNNYTTVETHAVATLMKACGYSVKMNYTTGESGAYSKVIGPALITYFGYDQGVQAVSRSTYKTQQEWDDMIYNELTSSGPVIYSGQSTSGAHCFVCDGYDGKGYFHINWGWGGMSDGYFLLNELTPGEIGTGGHYGGYNLYQDAVIGIMPPVGRLTVEGISIDNAADDSGNVKGWGYTYRINDFSHILLSVSIKISGGHVSAPLYYTIYDWDPETKLNKEEVASGTFSEPLNASDGNVTCSTYISLKNFDPSKVYTINVAYDLKGQRTAIGSIRMAASSGVEDILADDCQMVEVYSLSGIPVATGENIKSLRGITPGLYIVKATASDGTTKTAKLHLR